MLVLDISVFMNLKNGVLAYWDYVVTKVTKPGNQSSLLANLVISGNHALIKTGFKTEGTQFLPNSG